MLQVFFVFLYTGFIAFGGGLATIPILLQEIVMKGYISSVEFYRILAISQATPGPLGLNLATYVGYVRGGVLGAILSSIGISISGVLCTSINARIYEKIKDNDVIVRIMGGIRAAITGVVFAALLEVAKASVLKDVSKGFDILSITSSIQNVNVIAIILILIFSFMLKKFKLPPIVYLIAGGFIGYLVF